MPPARLPFNMPAQTAVGAILMTVLLLFFIFQSSSLYLTYNSYSPLASVPRKNAHYTDQSNLNFYRNSLRVGMDLTASYGTIAVGYPNGTVINVAKVEGNDAYGSLMHRLSLRSSRHPNPPYDNMWDYFQDQPRQDRRKARKAQGLPASDDVAVIAHMILSLQSVAEMRLNVNITSTVVAVPYLLALYSEDILDAFEYSAINLVDVNTLKGYEHEPNVAFAGYGLGLCHNHSSYKDCDAAYPTERILSILYTRTALAVAFSKVGSAYYAYESPILDIDLGFDERNRNPNQNYYWEAVRDKIMMPLVEYEYFRPVGRVLLIGESALNEKFNQVLEEALGSVLEEMPPIYRDDPLFVVARGALEFVSWGLNNSQGAIVSSIAALGSPILNPQVEL